MLQVLFFTTQAHHATPRRSANPRQLSAVIVLRATPPIPASTSRLVDGMGLGLVGCLTEPGIVC
jgi:hypothetical protein